MSKYNSRSEVPEKYKWDLTDFFKDDKDFENNLKLANERVDYQKKYKSCTKDSNKLLEFLKYDLETECLVENLYGYSFMKDDEELGNSNNINRKNKALSLLNDYSNVTSFFSPELLTLSAEEYDKLFKDTPELKEFKFMLDEIYKDKDHTLKEEEEIIINELEVAMNNFEDISSNLLNNEHDYGTVNIDGKDVEIHSTNYRNLMKNTDKNVRKEVFYKYKSVIDRYAGTSASLLNSYVKANNTNSKLHKFDSAWSEKIFDYNMPEKAYNTLEKTVENHLNVLHKYYALFKNVNDDKDVHTYDLNLNLASSTKKYSIEEAIELIRKAISPLGNDYVNCFNRIIDNHYIDFCEYKGKRAGGYSLSTSNQDSRILLSFNDDLSSVSTIAHECGHNVHHQFVKNSNPVQYRTVTTLVSEVVSLTNECLLSNYLVNNGTKEEKLAGLNNLMEVIVSNLFSTVKEGKMEVDFNNYSNEGNAITKEYMNDLALEYMKKYYGDKVIIDEYASCDWARRGHYYDAYYLFNYAFCISVALANTSKILSGDKDALDRYIKFISLGGDVYPIDAFKVLEFDLTDKKVYEDAIEYFDSLIKKFKKISEE